MEKPLDMKFLLLFFFNIEISNIFNSVGALHHSSLGDSNIS